MSDQTCKHCGCAIERINYALGPQWMHVAPAASFPTTGKGTAWSVCRAATVAASKAAHEPAVPSNHTATTEDAARVIFHYETVGDPSWPDSWEALTENDRNRWRTKAQNLADRGLLATAPSAATVEDAARAMFVADRAATWPGPSNAGRRAAQQWGDDHVEEVRKDYLRRARALAAAGLLATARPDTTTEWGVRGSLPGGDMTESVARKFAAEVPGHAVVRREVTAWMEADHVADYTPTTDQVRDHWCVGGASEEGFDRRLAAHDAEVAAQALDDAADAIDWQFETFVTPDGFFAIREHDKSPGQLLRERAAVIREGGGQ